MIECDLMPTREIFTHHEKVEQLHNANFLLIVVGPTASGKTTIIRRFLERYPTVKNVVSVTTRKMRPDEVNHVACHFISEEEFLAKKGILTFVTNRDVEGAIVHYGVQKEDVDGVLLGEARTMHLDMETATRLQEELEKLYESEVVARLLAKTLVVFLGTSSLFTLKDRYLSRDRINDTRQTFLNRMRYEWTLWKKLRGHFSHIVMNENTIDAILNDIARLLNACK